MVCCTREKWRLGVNMILAEILTPILFGISVSLYLPSFHRFVTNPTTDQMQNETLVNMNEAEPGLGESELFYSILISVFFVGEVVGGLLSGFFIKCIPHWYQFLFAISLHIIGYVLYGIATNGWVLMVGLFLAGYFIGAQLTLSLNYATEMSVEYVNLLRDQAKREFDYEKKIIRTRNFLYAVNSAGFGIGYTAGPVVAVLFSHLPIEQYRPVAWFNLAFGGMLLLLFAVLFRGESKWKRVDCHQACMCSTNNIDHKPGPLQIFIIITMHLLSFVQMLRWGFFEELMNPVLTDYFGLTIKASSYVYIGIAFSNVLGSLLLFILQRLKISTQAIAFIGIVMTIAGYLLTTDWQAIPYDPCTEYSPFHHPERYLNHSNDPYVNNSAESLQSDLDTINLPSYMQSLKLLADTKLDFTNGQTINIKIPFDTSCECHRNSSCGPVCEGTTNTHKQLCVSFPLENATDEKLYSCSLSLPKFELNLCVNITRQKYVEPKLDASAQSFLLLPTDVYAAASNACLSADISSEQCHWIPFSMAGRCADCPPICRGEQRTLLFPLYVIGMLLVVGSYQVVWVNLVAIANNQTPESIQGIVIGSISAANGLAEAVSPMIAGVLYEGYQKRIFPSSLLFAFLNFPFLIEIIVLYKYLGPTHKFGYSPIKDDDHS